MFSKAYPTFTVLLSLSLAVGTSANATVAKRDTCSCDDVHFFLARGNNEFYPGRQAAIINAVCKGLDSCGYEDLIYSALYTDLYCQTAYDGTIAGHSQMTAYAQRCPDSKLILAGYSQGAQIATDILGGAGAVLYNGCIQPEVPAMDRNTSPGNKIVAAIVFGNVRHTGNQAYNFGNGSSMDSTFPRPSDMLTALDAYSPILRDWCLDTDQICSGKRATSTRNGHLSYYDLYTEEAASWVLSVASLTPSAPTTAYVDIPISVSGTAQDYATVGTETPSGTVTLDATWSNLPTQGQCVAPATTSDSSSVASQTTSTPKSTTPVSSGNTPTPNVTTTPPVNSDPTRSATASQSSSFSTRKSIHNISIIGSLWFSLVALVYA